MERVRGSQDVTPSHTGTAGCGLRDAERLAERRRQVVVGERAIAPIAAVLDGRGHERRMPLAGACATPIRTS